MRIRDIPSHKKVECFRCDVFKLRLGVSGIRLTYAFAPVRERPNAV